MTLKSGFYGITAVLAAIGTIILFAADTVADSNPLSTLTPTATIVYDATTTPQLEKYLLISDVLQKVGENCHLPCFLGFQPGETTVDSIITYLEETGFSSSWESSPERKRYPTLEDYLT